MATYDYRCRTCESTFEIRHSMMADPPVVACPHGHGDVARIWSAVSMVGAATTATMPSGGGTGCCGGDCCA